MESEIEGIDSEARTEDVPVDTSIDWKPEVIDESENVLGCEEIESWDADVDKISSFGIKLDATESNSDAIEIECVGVSTIRSNSDAMGSISETGEETIVSVGVNNIEEDVVTYCSASALESDAGIFLYSIFVMTSVIIFVL